MSKKRISPEQLNESSLVRETFNFWFHDHEHIRSPFPRVIQEEIKDKSVKAFYDWLNQLDDDTENKNEEGAAREKLESFIFDIGLKLVKSDDEKITIYFPFLPRLGDIVEPGMISGTYIKEKSYVLTRKIEVEEDIKFLNVELKTVDAGHIWNTRFELPA